MSMLSDGTVVPSFLSTSSMGNNGDTDGALLSNYVLRYGEVKAISYPGDVNHQHESQIEYIVEIVHREDLGPNSKVLYRGVTTSSLFGGYADRFDFTLRADAKKSSPDGVGVGSKVLVLCISGDQSKAIILGGIRDAKLHQTKDTKAKGHNLFFEFNGANFTVNDEGEARFTHWGPTDANGGVKEDFKEFLGTNVEFDKYGSLTITGPSGQEGARQKLSFVHHDPNDATQDGSIQVQADKLLKVHVAGQMELSSDGNTFIDSNDGGITLTAKDGVFVGSATDSWMKGTTYRVAEGTMNNTLATSFTSAASLYATMSATLMAAAGLNAIPMVGGILAMPAFIALAGQLGALGGLMGTMGGAISAMEGNANTFLSKKNKTD